jgi:hypothetical protein
MFGWLRCDAFKVPVIVVVSRSLQRRALSQSRLRDTGAVGSCVELNALRCSGRHLGQNYRLGIQITRIWTETLRPDALLGVGGAEPSCCRAAVPARTAEDHVAQCLTALRPRCGMPDGAK